MAINYSGSYTTPRLELGEAMLEYTFSHSNLIGATLFPYFRTSKKKADFPRRVKETMLKRGNTKRAPRSAYSRSGSEVEDVEYSCQEYGEESQLDHSERELYASDFDAELAASEDAMWHVLMDHESRVKDIVLNTTTFTTGNGRRTDVSTAWSTTSADIIGDVTAACEAVRLRTGLAPNVLAFGAAVLPYMIRNTAIRASIQPTQLPTKDAILMALAALFGLEKVVIGGQVENTADEGQTATIADIWGSGWAVVARVADEGASLRVPCLGRTMLWVNDSPEAVMVESYEESQTRSTVFRARHHVDELLIDADLEQLLDIAG